MKIAFYMAEATEQIVLTPESEWERKMLALLHDSSRTLSVFKGSFYETSGGWIRHSQIQSDASTMIRLLKKPLGT